MNLTKKQVKALLDVVSAVEMRTIRCRAEVQLYNDKPYLVATNGYVLAALELGGSLSDLVGLSISRAELTKWYSLAAARDHFTDDTVRELAAKHGGTLYPDWPYLLRATKGLESKVETDPQNTISFNASYCATMQTLSDTLGLTWTFNGGLPMVAETGGMILFVMPLHHFPTARQYKMPFVY